MELDIVFEENNAELPVEFEAIQEVTDGGYDKGYAKGEADTKDALGDISGVDLINGDITHLYSEQVTSIRGYCFYANNVLLSAEFPNVKTVQNNAFQVCQNITTIKLQSVTNLYANSFRQCYALSTLVIGTDTVCHMQATSCLQNTAIANGNGLIYVPAALVDQYKLATNWTTYADQIRAIEDYPDIVGV